MWSVAVSALRTARPVPTAAAAAAVIGLSSPGGYFSALTTSHGVSSVSTCRFRLEPRRKNSRKRVRGFLQG